jgi:predicted dehydrogenase
MARVTVMMAGTGLMGRLHLESMLQQKKTTDIVGLVEVSPKQKQAARGLFERNGVECPPVYRSIQDLIRKQGAPETSFIVTPHKFHLEHARECLEAGMDVLLEKPMVVTAIEARRLIAIRGKTGRELVIAFPGSLSPSVQKAKQLIRKGAVGRVSGVAAYVYQDWKDAQKGQWRQKPEISGGGFLFDTGSHMINTVVDLVGEDVVEVSALQDNRGAPVEIVTSISGRFAKGAIFSLSATGDSIYCNSQVTVFGTDGILTTGIWGGGLGISTRKRPELKPVPCGKAAGDVWSQFLRVRKGTLKNPCPAEVGLRFALLMDMIKKSARTGKTVRA